MKFISTRCHPSLPTAHHNSLPIVTTHYHSLLLTPCVNLTSSFCLCSNSHAVNYIRQTNRKFIYHLFPKSPQLAFYIWLPLPAAISFRWNNVHVFVLFLIIVIHLRFMSTHKTHSDAELLTHKHAMIKRIWRESER